MALTTNSMMTFGLLHSSLMKTARAHVSVQEEAIYTAQCREYAVRCACGEPLDRSSVGTDASSACRHCDVKCGCQGPMSHYSWRPCTLCMEPCCQLRLCIDCAPSSVHRAWLARQASDSYESAAVNSISLMSLVCAHIRLWWLCAVLCWSLLSAFSPRLAGGLLLLNQVNMRSGIRRGTVRQLPGAACRRTGSCAARGTTSVPSTCSQLVCQGGVSVSACVGMSWASELIGCPTCSTCHVCRPWRLSAPLPRAQAGSQHPLLFLQATPTWWCNARDFADGEIVAVQV